MTPNDAPDRNSELLLEYIAHNDVHCKVCGYNLRGLTRDVCPECGVAFQLDVASPALPMGRLMLLLLPLAMSAGVGLLFLLLMLAWGVPGGRQARTVFGFVALGVVSGIAAALVHRRRRAFFRATRGRQTQLIVVAWLLMALGWGALLAH